MRYGQWTVVETAVRKSRVRCSCGTERWVQTYTLKAGKSTNCGCARGKPRPAGYRLKAKRATDHPLYEAWKAMNRRCSDPGAPGYSSYGGRGISVCEAWRGQEGFWRFVADMGERSEGVSLDRINNDGPYAPENCRWATRSEQNRNTRLTRYVQVDGAQTPVATAAEQLNVVPETIKARLDRGWAVSDALSTQDHSPTRALTDEQVEEIHRTYRAGCEMYGGRALARHYGVHLATIQRALRGYVLAKAPAPQ